MSCEASGSAGGEESVDRKLARLVAAGRTCAVRELLKGEGSKISEEAIAKCIETAGDLGFTGILLVLAKDAAWRESAEGRKHPREAIRKAIELNLVPGCMSGAPLVSTASDVLFVSGYVSKEEVLLYCMSQGYRRGVAYMKSVAGQRDFLTGESFVRSVADRVEEATHRSEVLPSLTPILGLPSATIITTEWKTPFRDCLRLMVRSEESKGWGAELVHYVALAASRTGLGDVLSVCMDRMVGEGGTLPLDVILELSSKISEEAVPVVLAASRALPRADFSRVVVEIISSASRACTGPGAYMGPSATSTVRVIDAVMRDPRAAGAISAMDGEPTRVVLDIIAKGGGIDSSTWTLSQILMYGDVEGVLGTRSPSGAEISEKLKDTRCPLRMRLTMALYLNGLEPTARTFTIPRWKDDPAIGRPPEGYPSWLGVGRAIARASPRQRKWILLSIDDCHIRGDQGAIVPRLLCDCLGDAYAPA